MDLRNGFTCDIYGGRIYGKNRKNVKPKDNTYQLGIPGTQVTLDASHGPAIGKGHKINECWNPEHANVKYARDCK